jgi:hypothetical protein
MRPAHDWQAPADQLKDLSGRLADARIAWFDSATYDAGRCYVLDIVPHGADVARALNRLKGLLLYFERVAIPDPLAYFDNWISFSIDRPSVRTHLRKLLTFLSELAPLVATGDILLVPVVAYKNAPFASHIETEIAERHLAETPPPEAWARRQMILHGNFCAEYEYIPLATSQQVADFLDSDFGVKPHKTITGDRARIASAALTYRIPGTQHTSLREVLELRKNEVIFAEFRAVFGKLLAQANDSSDQESFQLRLREAMDSELRPLVRNLNQMLKRSSVISDLLIPGAASLGGTWLAVELLNNDPRSSLIAAGMIPIAWAAKCLLSSAGKERRNAKQLLAFYGRMIEKE